MSTRYQLEKKIETLKARTGRLDSGLKEKRIEQEGVQSKIKSLQKKYDELNKTAFAKESTVAESRSAQINRETKVGKELRAKQARNDKIPDEINEMEVEWIKAKTELEDYEAELAKMPKPKPKPSASASRPSPNTMARARGARAGEIKRTIHGPSSLTKAPPSPPRRKNISDFAPPTYGVDGRVADEMRRRSRSQGLTGYQLYNGKTRAERLAEISRPDEKGALEKAEKKAAANVEKERGKRKLSVLEDDDQLNDALPGKKRKIAKASKPKEDVLKDKSTNGDVVKKPKKDPLKDKSTKEDEVAPDRSRPNKRRPTKKRAASDSKSRSASPVKKARYAIIPGLGEDEDSEDDTPKCPATTKPAAADKAYPSTAADAPKTDEKSDSKADNNHMFGKRSPDDFQEGAKGVARPASRGMKRTAAWSVGDARDPEAKRAKTSPSTDGSSAGKGGSEDVKESAGGEGSENKFWGKGASQTGSNSIDNIASTTGGTPEQQNTGNSTNETELEDGEIDETYRRPARTGLRGINNHGLSCFSSAILQLFDDAIDSHDLNALLSGPEQVEEFGLSDADCKKCKNDSLGMVTDKWYKKMGEARNLIQHAARKGKTADVSVAKHLRHFLEDLRDNSDSDVKNVSAFRFQSVLAHGALDPESATMRKQMSGVSWQEDIEEYYTCLLGALQNDAHTADSAAVKKLFTIQTEEKHVCACGHESTPRKTEGDFHKIIVPKTTEKQSLEGLFQESLAYGTDFQCATCKGEGSTKDGKSEVAFDEPPENFVFRMSRHPSNGGFDKITTEVELDMNDFDAGDGSMYDLSTVIMHQGTSATKGHYFCFRKLENQWYKLDDGKVERVSASAVKDDRRAGQCAMLLFKKRQL